MRAALLVIFAACSGSSGSPPDVQAPPVDAYDTGRCLIQGAYGDLGQITGSAGSNAGATTVTVVLDPGPPGKDDFFLKLVPGQGAFAGGAVAPGTYTIQGDDAGYTTCGVCAHIIADITSTGPSKFYFAHSGTITLTSVTPPIHGTASNLEFSEIDINGGAEVPGGCKASITSMELSTP